jgi:aryl-alcohol dehydrogenase-like predicted oxidoreductase
MECSEGNLRNLGTGTIELLQLHVWNPERIEAA